jgi:acetyl esterase/lipase
MRLSQHRRTRWHGAYWSVTSTLLFTGLRASLASPGDEPRGWSREDFVPGSETALAVPGSERPLLVYVPTDYTPDRTWPVILCYHGGGRQTTTWPFRQVTGGAGFIVVGMVYVRDEYFRILDPVQTTAEKKFFRDTLARLAESLAIDRRCVFMGGFSQGGYSTTVLGEQLLDDLAGLVILGAGRRNIDRLPPTKRSIQKKPVFVGVGANDKLHNGHAQRAAKNYRAWGASVTFEEWPELGHQADANSATLATWLTDTATRVRETRPPNRPPAKPPTTTTPKPPASERSPR